jgi:transposase-like protein
MPSVIHNTERCANNRAEVSHELNRQPERQMRGFKSAAQAQRQSLAGTQNRHAGLPMAAKATHLRFAQQLFPANG